VLPAQPSALGVTYGEHVGQAPALQADACSFVAPTTSDPVAGVPASTQFLVRARNSSGSRCRFSNVKVGRSLDNLAPAVAAPFAGVDSGGVSLLTWHPRAEPDLAGYRAGGTTTLRFGLATAGRASLAFHDASGRRIRELVADTLEAGEHAIAWDGRDESGRAAAPGLDFRALRDHRLHRHEEARRAGLSPRARSASGGRRPPRGRWPARAQALRSFACTRNARALNAWSARGVPEKRPNTVRARARFDRLDDARHQPPLAAGVLDHPAPRWLPRSCAGTAHPTAVAVRTAGSRPVHVRDRPPDRRLQLSVIFAARRCHHL